VIRVVHLFAHAPDWRHPWAAAAREFADVVTVRTTRGRLPGGFERTEEAEYAIALVKIDPEMLTAPFVAALMKRRYAALLGRIVEDHGSVDLLHAHFYSAALHVAGLGLPYVVSEHTTVFTRRERPSVTRRSARAAQRVYDRASLVMPVSASLEADMRRAGIRARTRVIPNPIDVERFSPAPRSLPVDEVRVLAAQRLVQTKGFDVLLRALFVARALDRRVVLRVAGSGSERSALECLADTLGLTDAVTFLGQVAPDVLVKEMHNAHVFAFPSRGDSFGLPVVEALSTGLPVVGTAVGIVPDLLTSERGVLVPVDDIRAFATAVLRIAADPGAYPAEVVSAGIRDRFSVPAVARQLRDAYSFAITPGRELSVDFR
jgi:L-malate glycosyltransferase